MPETQIYSLGSFKGLNELPIIEDGESPDCIGVCSDYGTIRKQKGYTIKYSNNFGAKIVGIYEYIKSSLESWLLVVANNKVWKRKLKPIPDSDFTQLPIKENTLFSCAGNKIYRHRGYSDEILDYITITYTPTPNLTGLTIANGNFVTCDDVTDLLFRGRINIHNGLTENVSHFFPSPHSNPSGVYFDGTDLWSCDKGLSKIYHHSGLTDLILEDFDSPGIAPTGITVDNIGNLISGNKERYGRFISLYNTTTAYNKFWPKIIAYKDRLHIAFIHPTLIAVSYFATATIDLDGGGWQQIDRISESGFIDNPDLQILGEYIYGICCSSKLYLGRMPISTLIWTTLFAQNRGVLTDHYNFQIVEKIYFMWVEVNASIRQIWSATSDLNGGNFIAVQRTTSSVSKDYLRFKVEGNKIYCVWAENNHIWTACVLTDDTALFGTRAKQRTSTTFERACPQILIKNNKIYYVWQQKDGAGIWQLWTATENIDGTEWKEIRRTSSAFSKEYPQQEIEDTEWYFIWQQKDSSSKDQICTICISINDTAEFEAKMIIRTSSTQSQTMPQFKKVENKIYYIWLGFDGTYNQICIARTNLGTVFVHKQKTSLIDNSYITTDEIDDIYFDAVNKNLVSCDSTTKKISIYQNISNIVKGSFTVGHEPKGLSWTANLDKTSNFLASMCDFITLNDIMVMSTGEKWLLRWNGTGDLASTVPTTNTLEKVWLKNIILVQNTVFGICIDNPSRLKWSNYFEPDIYYNNWYLDVEKDDGDVLKGISNFRNQTIVFKENSQHNVFFTGDNTMPFGYSILNNIGTINHRNIIQANNMVYFISKDGIKRFEGINSPLISLKIPKTFAKILLANYDKVVAINMENAHQIWWTIPETTAGEPKLIIYDYILDCWACYGGYSTEYMTYLEYVNGEYLGGSNTGYLYKLNDSDGYNNQNMLGRFYTKEFDFGLPDKHKKIKKLVLSIKPTIETKNLTIKVIVDNVEQTSAKSVNMIGIGDKMIKRVNYELTGKKFQFIFETIDKNNPFTIYSNESSIEYEIMRWR